MTRDAAVVLLWNPSPETQFDADEASFRGVVEWSVGRRTTLEVDTPAWLFHQGRGARGLLGRGTVKSTPAWDEETERNWVDVVFDEVLPLEQMLPVESLVAKAPGGKWNNRYQSGQSIPAEAHDAVTQLWQRWLCSRDGRGHNVAKSVAQQIIAEERAVSGVFRQREDNVVDIEVDGHWRRFWTHSALELERAVTLLGLPPAITGMYESTVQIWKDELLTVDGPDGKRALFSVAPIGEARPCDRAHRIGACPNCGGHEVQDLVMGMPASSLMDDPNYQIGGCVISGHEPEYVCATCEHGWGIRV